MPVREITDFDLWDSFVGKSPQGTIFCKSDWLKLYGEFKLYGYFKNDSLLGGICGFVGMDSFHSGYDIPLTPFQGVLVAPQPDAKYTAVMSMQNDVSEKLLDFLLDEYSDVGISNHYTFPDMRPFLWEGWTPEIKYTYVVDISDLSKTWANLEKQTRYDINKAQREGRPLQWALGYFDELYEQTFERKGMVRPVSKGFLKELNNTFDCRIVGTSNSMAYVVWDSKRAYYILGASDGTGSALSVWTMFDGLNGMGIKEVDLIGANTKEIASFKSGFGGKLRAYYQVTNL